MQVAASRLLDLFLEHQFLVRGRDIQRAGADRANPRAWRKIGGHLDVPCESECFQKLQVSPSEINLPGIKAVPCRRWKCMMVVVPAFTHGRDREQRHVVAL